MRRLLTMILLAAGLLCGQEKPQTQESTESFEAAVIPVKTLTGDSFNRLVKLLGAFGAKFSSDDQLRTIVVYAPKDVVEQMRKVIEKLDQPGSDAAIGRNIEMTLTFLRCSTEPNLAVNPLPADLEAVAKQLRAVTQYRNIQIWDIVPLRLQEGKETTQAFRLPGDRGSLPAVVGQLNIHTEAVTQRGDGRYVRFRYFKVSVRMPYPTQTTREQVTQFQFMDMGLNTAGDFKEGQKTVLGKISAADDDSALFVVISLNILD